MSEDRISESGATVPPRRACVRHETQQYIRLVFQTEAAGSLLSLLELAADIVQNGNTGCVTYVPGLASAGAH